MELTVEAVVQNGAGVRVEVPCSGLFWIGGKWDTKER